MTASTVSVTVRPPAVKGHRAVVLCLCRLAARGSDTRGGWPKTVWKSAATCSSNHVPDFREVSVCCSIRLHGVAVAWVHRSSHGPGIPFPAPTGRHICNIHTGVARFGAGMVQLSAVWQTC